MGRIVLSRTLIVMAAIGGLGTTARADDSVRVRVHAEHAAGRVVYHYQIENRGRTDLRQFVLGCDCRPADRVATPLLEVAPVGAQPGEPSFTGTDPIPAPDLIRVPSGWQVHARRPKDADRYWLEFHMHGARGLAPGQTAKGISIALPRPDREFLIGRYAVPDRNVVNTIEPLDATPPRLTLRVDEVTSATTAGQMRVRVQATVDDDYDPAPRLALESFVPDEAAPTGDIHWSQARAPARTQRYTVTYTATDASGNATRASIKVVVPTVPAGGGGSVMLPTALHSYGLIP